MKFKKNERRDIVKKVKGFTLIELLAVLILLAVIGLITLPIVNNSINNSRQRALEETIKNIEHAALTYSVENNLGMDPEYKTLTLDELKTKGYLENKDIINPITNEEMTGCILYKWDTSHKQYEFTYSEECKSSTKYAAGDYLKIEVGTNETHNFYVLKDNGDTVTLIMDRNIGDNVPWLTEEDLEDYITKNNIDISKLETEKELRELLKKTGPLTANNYLNTLTEDWKNVIEKRIPNVLDIFTHSNFYNSLTETEKINWEESYMVSIETAISSEEVQNVAASCIRNTCIRNVLESTGNGKLLFPEWLDINLYTSGDDTKDINQNYKNGYWLNDISSLSFDQAWIVANYGFGFINNVEAAELPVGVRPVITINKSYVVENITDTLYTGKVIDYIEFNTDYNLTTYLTNFFDNNDYDLYLNVDLSGNGSYGIGMVDLEKYTDGAITGYALALAKGDFSEGQMIYASEPFDLSSQIPWVKTTKVGWQTGKIELDDKVRITILDHFMEIKDSVVLSAGVTK